MNKGFFLVAKQPLPSTLNFAMLDLLSFICVIRELISQNLACKE